MAQLLVDVLERHAVGLEERGAGVMQIVGAKALQSGLFRDGRESPGQTARLDPLSQLVHVDVIPVFITIASAAKTPVLRLPQSGRQQGRQHL